MVWCWVSVLPGEPRASETVTLECDLPDDDTNHIPLTVGVDIEPRVTALALLALGGHVTHDLPVAVSDIDEPRAAVAHIRDLADSDDDASLALLLEPGARLLVLPHLLHGALCVFEQAHALLLGFNGAGFGAGFERLLQQVGAAEALLEEARGRVEADDVLVPAGADVVVVAVLERRGHQLGRLGHELAAGDRVRGKGLWEEGHVGDDGGGGRGLDVARSAGVLCCHVGLDGRKRKSMVGRW
jgi:hypothetical protein